MASSVRNTFRDKLPLYPSLGKIHTVFSFLVQYLASETDEVFSCVLDVPETTITAFLPSC